MYAYIAHHFNFLFAQLQRTSHPSFQFFSWREWAGDWRSPKTSGSKDVWCWVQSSRFPWGSFLSARGWSCLESDQCSSPIGNKHRAFRPTDIPNWRTNWAPKVLVSGTACTRTGCGGDGSPYCAASWSESGSTWTPVPSQGYSSGKSSWRLLSPSTKATGRSQARTRTKVLIGCTGILGQGWRRTAAEYTSKRRRIVRRRGMRLHTAPEFESQYTTTLEISECGRFWLSTPLWS